MHEAIPFKPAPTVTHMDIVVIGAGPAGLAAGIAAREAGCSKIVLLERDQQAGGILQQCIHNGFGLHYFKEELTGPEYAARFIKKARQCDLPILCNTMVIDLQANQAEACYDLTAVSPEHGLLQIRARAVILAMGCRERPRGALGIPGSRCAGIMTTGAAQRLVNREGLLPGKRIVILGSGDIGLIMARRMTFEGASVLACVELMPFSSGLTRNVVQCLHDFDIPLLLNHTVIDIEGRERLTAVTIAQVDPDSKTPITGTERRMECDTLLLSVGLIPENELTRQAGAALDPQTQGPVVDQRLACDRPGLFACGNVLHVHDLVDFVSAESELAGRSAWAYCQRFQDQSRPEADAIIRLPVVAGSGVRGVVPQYIRMPTSEQEITVSFRPDQVYRRARIKFRAGKEELVSQLRLVLAPGEMAEVKLGAEQWQQMLRLSQHLPDQITISIEA